MNVSPRGTETLLLAGLLALCGCAAKETAAAPEKPASVPTEIVKLSPVDQVYEASGTVRAHNTAVLSARVPGSITSVRAKAGDRVSRGQVLLTLESAELEAQVSRAQAGQTVAQGGIVEAERGQAAAEANARLTASTYARYRELLAKKSVSPQEFDEVEARQRAAQAELEMARARQQQARARLEQAQAEGRAASAVRSYAAVTAPFSGIVTERKADPGTVAFPGAPLLTIEEDDQFRLEVEVAESKAGTLRDGQTARVALDSPAGEWDAQIVEIQPAADPMSRSLLVKLQLPKIAGLRSGAFGRARFVFGRRDAITVPATAVERRGQLASVTVSDANGLHRRLVTTGVESGGRVEILSGLSPNEKVAVKP